MILVACGAGLATSSLGQQPAHRTIPDQVSCSRCRIVLRTVVTLGSDTGPGSFDQHPRSTVVDRAGRYWVASAGGLVQVFDANGGFVARVGSRGSGPGEFLQPYSLALLPGDSVLVPDYGTQRATVVGPNLRAAREIRLVIPVSRLLVVSWPSNVWINASIRTPASVGWPLHRVSMAGEDDSLITSFGAGSGESRPGFDDDVVWMTMASSGPWTGTSAFFGATSWTSRGQVKMTMVRAAPWFKYKSQGTGTPHTPPGSFIQTMYESDGRLWAVVRVPSPTWREAWRDFPEDMRARREAPTRAIALEKLWRTTIEAIDLKAGRVLQRVTLEEQMSSFLPGGVAVIRAESQAGAPRLRIARLELVGG
jgi:hypothetical protein